MLNFSTLYQESIDFFLKEDDLSRNFGYLNSLPSETVKCSLKIKDDMILSGVPFFIMVFERLIKSGVDYKYRGDHLSDLFAQEGKSFKKEDKREFQFDLPFNVALSGERLALNLLQRSSSISTFTSKFVEAAGEIKILDTRKTIPGLRFLEKYAVKMGGGTNHRFSQADVWMVKDNHKAMFGGLKSAVEFFQNQNAFYQPIVVEVHSLSELEEAYTVGVKHVMLDNFSPDEVKEAIKNKKEGTTFEVSGGINLENIKSYCLDGVDAFSSGSITYNAKQVDLSLKMVKW